MSSQDDLTDELGSQQLVDLLLAVDQSVSQAKGPHIVDDDELLDRWSASSLKSDEHAQILTHIAHCRECSDVLQEMIATEAFVLPELIDKTDDSLVSTEGSKQRLSQPSVSTSPTTGRKLVRIAVSIAA